LAYDAIEKGVRYICIPKISMGGDGYPNFIHGAGIEKCIFAQRTKHYVK
jgi:hypothetical protein